MRPLDARFAAVAFLFATIICCAVARSDEEANVETRTVHADARAVIESVLDATRAYLEEDSAAARVALDRLKEQSPPLVRGRDDAYGQEILGFDQAFHITIDRSREYARSGYMEDSFNQFVWVQRACITCHDMARREGFLPQRTDSPESPE